MVEGDGSMGDVGHSCYEGGLFLRGIIQDVEITTALCTIARNLVDVMFGRDRGDNVTTMKKHGIPVEGPA